MVSESKSKRIVTEGLISGLIAGAVFAMAEVIVAAVMGMSPLMPFRMFASVVFGRGALDGMSIGLAFVLGGIVHFVLSSVYGMIYGWFTNRLSSENRASWARQGAIGVVYGIVLWVVNFQIIARLAYPWFLEANQVLQALVHALFYGLPVGLVTCAAERRVLGAAPATRTT